jgi:hypothetical protein
MKQLNEQTIKRLQKLAGINEIKIKTPMDGRLKTIIDEILQSDNDILDDLLFNWVEGISGNEDDPESEAGRSIDLNRIINRGNNDPGYPRVVLDYIDRILKVPVDAFYILGGEHRRGESYKFIKSSPSTLDVYVPENIDAFYDERGNVVI